MSEEVSDHWGFSCNLCSTSVTTIPFEALARETGTCPACAANVRIRAIVHLVSLALYGTSMPVRAWSQTGKVAFGVSDWPLLGDAFERALRYRNTQFDRAQYPDAPFLDVTDPAPELRGQADLVICSDVLEHVEPPIQAAFDGLFALLKPGGTLIFTVPYGLERTVEHFPDLHDWHFDERSGKRVLVNRTREGRVQEFDELCFHGGGDAVLEMRLFGLEDLREHFSRAGFAPIEVMSEDVLPYGIRLEPWSRPIVARRPAI